MYQKTAGYVLVHKMRKKSKGIFIETLEIGWLFSYSSIPTIQDGYDLSKG